MTKANKNTINLLGVKISRLNLSETLERFQQAIERDQKLRVSVCSVSLLIQARRDPQLTPILNTADIVTADGVPMIWASRLLDRPIRGRVTGLDLLPRFAEMAADKGYSFFLLGAGEGVAEQLASRLQHRYPGLKIAGTYTPPFAERFSEEENERMIERVNRAGTDVLWVSLTAPRQDFWIYEHFGRLNVNVALGVGAAFDVHAGLKSRAPVWMQKNGLEWFYRLLKEPRRLGRRYLLETPKFIPLILQQWIKEKRNSRISL